MARSNRLAAVLITAGIFLSRIVGLVRERLVATCFGTGLHADVFSAALRYDVNRAVTLHVNVDNIDNEIGLTEGNPRSGQFQSGDAGARYYIARPILGRSFRGAVTYRF